MTAATTTPVRFGTGVAGNPAVYYEVLAPIERATKLTIVMVHGGTQTGACYLRTADGRPGWAFAFAARGHTVVLPDWPGSGRSGAVPLDKLDSETICQGIGAVLAAQDAPVVLMTHSMSGALGWRVIEAFGDRISRVVAIAPGPPGNIQAQPRILSETDDAIELQALELRFTLSKREPHYPPMSFVEKKIVGEGWRFPRDRIGETGALMGTIAPRVIRQRLNVGGAQLKVSDFTHYRGKPMLVVVGSHDIDHPKALDEGTANWLTENGAAAEFWYLPDFGIEGNGHMMMQEDNSDAIAALIGGWIDGAPRRRG